MAIQTDIHYEITDTYGGEANYSWVKRGEIQCKPGEDYSDLAAVRRVKKDAGWNNVKCKRENYGDMIVLRPVGQCIIMFINFHSHGSAS